MQHRKNESAARRDPVGTAKGKKNEPEIEKVKGWPGYVRNGVWIIEKKIKGKKYHRSTHATTSSAARAQLARFEANPNGYNPAGDDAEPVEALVLDMKMIDAFHEWHSPNVGPEWAAEVRRTLKHWANHLAGADLRSLSLIDHLKPFIAGKGGKPRLVAAIKLLFKWLRTERGLVTRAQDVTLDFITPQFKPRQDTGKSKAVPADDLERVMPHLPVHVRDVLELLAVTGWHVAEVRRYAKFGRFRDRDVGDAEAVLAVIGTQHKVRKRKHFTNLLWPQHVEAARRIRERGHVIDRTALRKQLHRACRKAGVRIFNMGDMRASVATWLRLAGVPMAIIAEYLGHLSASTTRKFYVDSEITATVLPKTALRVVQGGLTG